MPLKIKIKNIENGVHYFDFNESPKSLGLNKPFSNYIKVNCKMDKSQNQFVLNCDLKVHTNFECDRCSEEFEAELERDFKLFYFFDEENIDDEDSNTFYIAPEEDYIDISKEVREYAMLSVPMKIVCDDDCKGLCAGCGVDLNKEECRCSKDEVRPEWEELLKLKDKINKQG
ncbi:MAG: DUF177 domain-containing protein [Ignavibacteriae bacterium]|jgi:uncharacterized protein|nr:DUF177 domain-containing protein [Ignavibacteriota bacterium]NOG98725.1 DUF177 domain-containing protein [Ignavibacteriota bacterium]